MAGTKDESPVLVDLRATGRLGGQARAAGMTAEERSASARKAVQARWAKAKAKAKKRRAK